MVQISTDSPIDEIHRIRREISDRFDADVVAIAEDAARRQAASNRPVWQARHDALTEARERQSSSDMRGASNTAAP